MAGPKENRVKVAEKEETGKFHGSPDGGPVNLRRLKLKDVGIKSLLNTASITAALIDVNAAQSNLMLLENS
ncbi:hypothetical protein Tco_0775779 [Tanacetum coccineum]